MQKLKIDGKKINNLAFFTGYYGLNYNAFGSKLKREKAKKNYSFHYKNFFVEIYEIAKYKIDGIIYDNLQEWLNLKNYKRNGFYSVRRKKKNSWMYKGHKIEIVKMRLTDV